MYFPTNVCNLKCAICWQRKGVHDYSELSDERQVQLIEEAAGLGVREFVIGGGGEPLARWKKHQRMFAMIKEAGMYGLLFTNGTLITPEVAAHLVEIQWDKVLVSIDGLRATNDMIRESGSFDEIIKGLATLLQSRGEVARPLVGVGCVLTRQGLYEIPELIELLGKMGCDQLNLIRLVVHLSSQRQFALQNNQVVDLPAILTEAMTVAESYGMVTNLQDYLDSELVQKVEHFDNVLLSSRTAAGYDSPFWDALCFEPFTNIVIHANGMVGPCCMSGDDPVASIQDRTLDDIWFGPEFARLREGILNRQPEPYCRICDLNVFQDNQRLREQGKWL
jgi:MoaA/NifB/PqqE/SkfB family radical SAM enzyme